MLWKRILVGGPIFFGIYFALWLDARYASTWGLTLGMAVFCILCLREFYDLCERRGWRPFRLYGYGVCVLLILAHERWCQEKWHGLPPLWGERSAVDLDLLTPLAALIVLGLFLLQILRNDPRGSLGNVAGTLLGGAYVWFMLAFIVRIRHLGHVHGWAYDGVELVLMTVAIAKLSDAGAYFIGKSFGRTKLIPSISPKKTWEGFLGGVGASVLMMLGVAWAEPSAAVAAIGLPRLVVFAIVLAVAALLGDLIESSFKRDAGVKDSGQVIPGYGGALDLVDSMMVAGPASYFYLTLVCGFRHGV